jgi:1-piperideine-2-carboxylate/1-pyrroline-2-carboxylate reductase [NAD(P)H]
MNLQNTILDAGQTATHLPWAALVSEIARLLEDDSVEVPARLVQALPGGGSLFVMPALDSRLAITKLITFTPGNAARNLPAIQGDVVVFDVATGRRILLLDGPTVTARRTAAVSVLAAKMLAPNAAGPLLIVGAGIQGKAHLEAFADVLGTREVMIASRSESSAQALARHAATLGLKARVVADANAALADCPLAVTCTPASAVVLTALPRPDAFVSAVGAFTPAMVELGTELCRYFDVYGRIFVDTADARHEAGDLLQSGLDLTGISTLADVLRGREMTRKAPVLFKSCGWAGWDLASARTACRHAATK